MLVYSYAIKQQTITHDNNNSLFKKKMYTVSKSSVASADSGEYKNINIGTALNTWESAKY